MNIPRDLQYTRDHEWVQDMGDGKARIGITDHAQEEMGDLVYIELPKVGDVLDAGDNLAVVESVKATSDVFAPVSGIVCAINDSVVDAPEEVNQSCYDAWLVEIENADLEELLSAEEYEDFLKEEI